MAAETSYGVVPEGREPAAYDHERRRLFWAMPSGLYLVGSRSGDQRNLMTANWATQAASSPKLLAVSVESGALTRRLVDESRAFALSLVARQDRSLVRRFVKPALDDPGSATLNGVEYYDSPSVGAPIPVGALGAFECRVTHRLELGSHVLYVGEVVDVFASERVRGGDAEVLAMADTRMNYGG